MRTPTPDNRRHELIDAALRAVSQMGASATTRKIAEEADAPLALLHYYFNNKRAIFEAVIERCQQIMLARFRVKELAGKGLNSTVYRILKEFTDWGSSEPGYHIGQYELFFWSLRTPGDSTFAATGYQNYTGLLERILTASLTDEDDPDTIPRIARDLMVIVDGITMRILNSGDGSPSDAEVRRYAAMITGQPAIRPETEPA